MQKYQLQGTIQNTSYREQYKSTTNRNNTNISATQYKIPVTGKYTKYQLQGTMQNTSYREQYKIPVTGNDAQYQFNSNIQLTGTIQRNQLQGTI